MQYSGLGELELAKQKTKYAIEKQAEEHNKQIKKEKEKEDKKKQEQIMKQVKQEILKTLQTIALTEFYFTFDLHYGQSYNKGMLRDSLKFDIDNDLRPKLSYTNKEFINKEDEGNARKIFNQNIQSNVNTSFFYGQASKAAQDDINFFGSLSQGVPDEINYDNLSQFEFEDMSNLQEKQPIIESKYIYEEAYTSALDKFMRHYKKVLKPELEKKYNIKL